LIGLIVVAILIFLLIQGFKLLFNPESDESIDETKKYLLYATLGVIVIGTCYVIVNSLIVSGSQPL
jgi:Na+-driven multidrug efflux pump